MTSPVNRRLAALVALLYVFFSTFGALTHSHALSEPVGSPDFRQTFVSTCASGSAPAHCPVCDWQSLQVTPPPVPPPAVRPALLPIEQTALSYRLLSLPAFRSASRGPPLA